MIDRNMFCKLKVVVDFLRIESFQIVTIFKFYPKGMVAYNTRALNQAQRNYSTHKGERKVALVKGNLIKDISRTYTIENLYCILKGKELDSSV